MGFVFKLVMQQSRTRPSIISWMGGGYLPVSFKKVLDCTYHITGGHKKDANFFRKFSLIQFRTLIHRRNLWNYICSMDPVCEEKFKKYWRLSILCCHVLLEQSIPAIMCLNGRNILRKQLNCEEKTRCVELVWKSNFGGLLSQKCP